MVLAAAQPLVAACAHHLLLSWRRGGFSVHNRVFAHPQDGRDFEALVRYMMRPPVSLRRLRFTPGAKEVVYARKGGHDTPEPARSEKIDAEGLRRQRFLEQVNAAYATLRNDPPAWEEIEAESPGVGCHSCRRDHCGRGARALQGTVTRGQEAETIVNPPARGEVWLMDLNPIEDRLRILLRL